MMGIATGTENLVFRFHLRGWSTNCMTGEIGNHGYWFLGLESLPIIGLSIVGLEIILSPLWESNIGAIILRGWYWV